jgi:hypothetical protein
MTDMQLVPLAETMQLGEVLARSGFFKDGRDASQAVVKVLAGREIGIGPIASMAGIYIVEGKVSIGSNLMAAAVKRSGKYDYTVVKLDNTQAVIMFWQKNPKTGDFAELGESSFSIAEAQAAGVAGKQVWKAYPRNMLFARAISNGVRWYCPDIFGGAPVYAPEELGATVDGETGEVIDMQPARVVTVEKPSGGPAWTPAAANDAAFEQLPSASQERAGNGKQAPANDRPQWKDADSAIDWGNAQGCFDHRNHAENAWNKVVTAIKAEHAPAIPTYAQVFDAWYADVQRRVLDHNAKIDAALDAQAAGDEMPVFESR